MDASKKRSSLSITPLLRHWDFDPTRVTARFVEIFDQEEPDVQLRLDLGILQMKLNGRPDGTTPHGAPSAMHHYRQRILTERRSGYRLDPDACAELQQECVQYYYRYLSLMVLRDYERVIRDTYHCLEIMELVDRYTDNEDLVWEFIQFKPYVIMMHTRGKAEQLAAEVRIDEAVAAIEAGISDIESFLMKLEEDPDALSECQEIGMLEDLIQDLREREGSENPVVALKLKMQHAVHMENYEEAARLRDSIEKMETGSPSRTAV
jgi:hypothetical protein